MLPIKKIICPTDFSEPAKMGLESAIELSDRFSAELVLIHVINPVPMVATAAPHLPTILEGLRESAQKAINDLFNNVIPKNMQARYHLVEGNTADLIIRTAEEENADLIVIATHGESGWRKLVFGSVAEKVIRSANCPVMVIRARE
jgi:nucleotide-binding universal stress UspA family protein